MKVAHDASGLGTRLDQKWKTFDPIVLFHRRGPDCTEVPRSHHFQSCLTTQLSPRRNLQALCSS